MAGGGGGGGGGAFKNTTFFVMILVVGALMGSFLGDFLALMFSPESPYRPLLMKQVTAGLTPTRLDLKLAEFTFGFVLKFNITSVAGILISAVLFKAALK